MTKEQYEAKAYDAIATSLRQFGYPDCTPRMIQDTHEAMQKGEEMPHFIIGMMACVQLKELQDAGVIQ